MGVIANFIQSLPRLARPGGVAFRASPVVIQRVRVIDVPLANYAPIDLAIVDGLSWPPNSQ